MSHDARLGSKVVGWFDDLVSTAEGYTFSAAEPTDK
jgi:hypothetical protein